MFWPRVARLLLRIGGWTIVGRVPDVDKAVIIAAPHTSNWDGYWAIVYKVAVGLDVKFFFKHSLFWFPLSVMIRGMGGIPLNRGQANSAVQQAIHEFDSTESFYFGLAPEGTRSKTTAWKTGFYRIAMGAGVPVAFGFLDYRRRQIGIGPMLTLTGDMDADLDVCRRFYAGMEGRRPDKSGPVVFPARQNDGTTTQEARSSDKL
jgi:1-acyl-sn-glycerol-3-phosphate acyltransferase